MRVPAVLILPCLAICFLNVQAKPVDTPGPPVDKPGPPVDPRGPPDGRPGPPDDPLSRDQENEGKAKGKHIPCRGIDCAEFQEVETLVRRANALAAQAHGRKVNESATSTLFGDIALTREQAESLVEMVQARGAGGSKRAKRGAYTESTSKRWPRTVPYVVDTSVFDSSEQNEIAAAIAFWRDNTCLEFQQYSASSPPTDQKYIYIQSGESGCWSYVGKLSGTGMQLVNIGVGCRYRAIIMHELAHALGTWHEHSRPDRDSYVNVLFENIRSDAVDNFYQATGTLTFGVPYDIGSVMHYSPTSFSSNGQNTLEALDPNMYPSMGQRNKGSFFDVASMNAAYSCGATCSGLTCQNNGIPNPNSCSCICPEGFGGTFCETAGTNAGCAPTTGEIIVSSTTEQCLESPNHPSVYYTDSNFLCNWILKANHPNNRIEYYFKDYFYIVATSSGLCYHWMEVKDGADLTLRGKRYCGSSAPTGTATSQTDTVVAHFDGSYTRPGYTYPTSFKLCYKLVENVIGCTCVHGTCQSGSSTCSTCDAGWTGANCDQDILECASDPCQNSGTCVEGTGGYSCTCTSDYKGTHCEQLVDPCSPSPCLNGGQCSRVSSTQYTCSCSADYTGTNCETYLDPCSSGPCKNGGQCTRTSGSSYSCSCAAGWQGTTCETDILECASDPCQNSGTCVEGTGGYSCTCTSDYTGTHCEQLVDPCSPSPCLNAGQCSRVSSSQYTCSCSADYTGTNCETYLDPCSSGPCKNGGQCSRTSGSTYSCSCAAGWQGTTCDIDILECASDPCQNSGTCVEGTNGYSCTCTSGYTGTNCETEVQPCDSNPCQNQGTCSNSGASYSCSCSAGWTGTDCSVDILECASTPCQNGGTCQEGQNGYTCRCQSGYSGIHCDIGPCNPSPCLNGGTCFVANNGSEKCSCTAAWSGKFCQKAQTSKGGGGGGGGGAKGKKAG